MLNRYENLLANILVSPLTGGPRRLPSVRPALEDSTSNSPIHLKSQPTHMNAHMSGVIAHACMLNLIALFTYMMSNCTVHCTCNSSPI